MGQQMYVLLTGFCRSNIRARLPDLGQSTMLSGFLSRCHRMSFGGKTRAKLCPTEQTLEPTHNSRRDYHGNRVP